MAAPEQAQQYVKSRELTRHLEALWQKRARDSALADGCQSSSTSTRSTLHAFRQIRGEGGEPSLSSLVLVQEHVDVDHPPNYISVSKSWQCQREQPETHL